MRATNDGNGLVGQPLQDFVKKVAALGEIDGPDGSEEKEQRTILEALLLEPDFSEETLKDKKALNNLQDRLTSYVNSGGAGSRRHYRAVWKKTRNTAVSSLFAPPRRTVPGSRPSSTGISHQSRVQRAQTLFTDLMSLGRTSLCRRERRPQSAPALPQRAGLSYVLEGGKKGQYIQALQRAR